MLIVFDVDGTLVGGEEVDWRCFDEAFHEVAGEPFAEGFFESIHEVTARAIVQQALPDVGGEELARIEAGVCGEYLRRLKAAHELDGGTFFPMEGAAEVLSFLEEEDGVEVAIATGDWEETILFKLEAAGIDVSGYPMATASDRGERSEIIRLSAERAGRSVEEAAYVGDGLWDYRATRKLGIPFLGVGSRRGIMVEHGARDVVPSLALEGFVSWLEGIRSR